MRTASLLTTPPPKQKPIAPSLPVASGRAFSHSAAATKSSCILARSTCLNSCRALLVVAGIAADRGEAVGREGDEIGDRQAPRDVLDIRVEAAVLVHDQDAGQLARSRSPDGRDSP